MTYDEFVGELRKAGLNVRGFAELVDMNRNSVSNYARSIEVPRHLAVIAVLLAEMNVHGVSYEQAISRVGSSKKKSRGRKFLNVLEQCEVLSELDKDTLQ